MRQETHPTYWLRPGKTVSIVSNTKQSFIATRAAFSLFLWGRRRELRSQTNKGTKRKRIAKADYIEIILGYVDKEASCRLLFEFAGQTICRRGLCRCRSKLQEG
jgi:hypothetical protein